jgi:hypothetical protein
LSDYSDSEIKELFEQLQLQIGLLLMKNIFDEQKLLNDLTSIFEQINELLNKPGGKLFFESIIAYLFGCTNIDTQKYIDKMETMTTQGAEIFVSTAMRLEMKGIKKVAYSLIMEGLDNKFIKKVTNLTDEIIEKLRSQQQNEFLSHCAFRYARHVS